MGSQASDQRTARPLSRRRQTLLIAGLIGLLLGLALILGPPYADDLAYLPDVDLPWWAIALAFAATDVFVLNVQARRETQTISLSEIPLVLGLFFAAPLALVVGRVVGSAAAMIGYRRSPPLKVAFNLSLILCETGLASPSSGRWHRPTPARARPPGSPPTWPRSPPT